MYLLYFDLLGVKHLWKENGVKGVKTESDEIKSLITSIAKKETSVNIVKGGFETDSVALVFDTAKEAVQYAVSLYREAFDYAKEEEFRLWFRGVIKVYDGGVLREESKGTEKLANVDIVKYSSELLDAIAVEKSGIKGMRLLIERSIVNHALKVPFRMKIGEKDLDIFKKLKNSPYPNKRLEPFEDVFGC